MDNNNNNNNDKGGFPGFPIINSKVSAANNLAKEGFGNGDRGKMPMGNYFHGEASTGSWWKYIDSAGAQGTANQSIFCTSNSENGWEMRSSNSTENVVSENYSDPIISTENVKTLRSMEWEILPHGSAGDHGHEYGAISFEEDAAVENESESRKRKREDLRVQNSWPNKPCRDPKVTFHVESIEDVPDDGYRWRKYGQKKVKGNSNPRSYYKCSNRRCCTKKQVERHARDPKYVVTTYEGKHNHEVPTEIRRKNKINSPDDNIHEVADADEQNAITTLPSEEIVTIPMLPQIPKFQTIAPHFDGEPKFNSEVGNFSGDDMNNGSSAIICQTNYSPWNIDCNAMPYGSYEPNLDERNYATPQAHTGGSVAADQSPRAPILLDLNLPPPEDEEDLN